MTETYDHIDMTYDNDSGMLTASDLSVTINKTSLKNVTLNVTFTGTGYLDGCVRKAVYPLSNKRKVKLTDVTLTLSSGSLYTGTASFNNPFSVSYFILPIQIFIETESSRYYSLNKLDFMVKVRSTT